MLEKANKVNGKVLGEKLFALKQKKYSEITNSAELKARWKRLWQCRTYTDFQRECFLRQIKWDPSYISDKDKLLPEGYYAFTTKRIIKHPQFVEELTPEGWYAFHDKSPKAVTVMFDCTKENCSRILNEHMRIVKTDKDHDLPVIYLRLDLRKLDDDILKIISNLLSERRKKDGIKTLGKLRETAIIALMFHDLKDLFGLGPEDIQRLMCTADEHYNFTNSFVKEKLSYAKKLLDHSAKRDFPPKTK